MQSWVAVAILCLLLALHNAQRLAPVPLFDELRLRLGVDYVGVGNLFSAYVATYALFSIPIGVLADKIDNKRLVAAGTLLSLVASLGFAVADSYPAAIAARLGLGFAGAFLYVPSIRYVVAYFHGSRRGLVMGFVEVGAGVGQMLALAIMPFLAERLGLVGAFLALPLFAGVILGGVLLGLRSARPVRGAGFRELGGLGRDARFWCLLSFQFLGMLAAYSLFGWLPTFVRLDFGFSPVQAGLAGALVNAGLSVVSPLAGFLSDRLGGRTPVLLAGSTLSVVCFLVLLRNRDPGVLLVTAFLAGASMAFTIPVAMVLAGEMFAKFGAGLAVSLVGASGQIAASISGPVFGYALEASHGFSAVWGLALVVAALRMPFLLGARERKEVASYHGH